MATGALPPGASTAERQRPQPPPPRPKALTEVLEMSKLVIAPELWSGPDLIRPCIEGSNSRIGRTWRALTMADRHYVGSRETLSRWQGRPGGRPGASIRGQAQREPPRRAESAPL